MAFARAGQKVAAVEELGLTNKMFYTSTAEGTIIQLLIGKQLLGVVALEKVAART